MVTTTGTTATTKAVPATAEVAGEAGSAEATAEADGATAGVAAVEETAAEAEAPSRTWPLGFPGSAAPGSWPSPTAVVFLTSSRRTTFSEVSARPDLRAA